VSDWLHLIGWPPSIITGGLLIFLSLGYGTQARRKLRPILLAMQVSVLTLILATLYNALNTGPLGMLEALLAQSFGKFLGLLIISWLVIKLCFIIRFRNGQTNIFTRNRRS
tara:strand:+ start:411 stop:743 length:333 start_codon:yes stop_codon:yes gene_type:complete